MGAGTYVLTLHKEFIEMLAEKLLLQTFLFPTRVLRVLSRLPSCASLNERKLGMQPGKRRYPSVSLWCHSKTDFETVMWNSAEGEQA